MNDKYWKFRCLWVTRIIRSNCLKRIDQCLPGIIFPFLKGIILLFNIFVFVLFLYILLFSGNIVDNVMTDPTRWSQWSVTWTKSAKNMTLFVNGVATTSNTFPGATLAEVQIPSHSYLRVLANMSGKQSFFFLFVTLKGGSYS